MKAAEMKEHPTFTLMKQTDVQSIYHMQMPRWLFSNKTSIKALDNPITSSNAIDYLIGKTAWTPAEFGLVDPPKTRFILEHQAYFSTISTAIVDFFFQFACFFFNFFEAAMTSSLAFFGCLLRGITFRQPCRHSTR